MRNDKGEIVHIHKPTKRDDLPEMGAHDACPECGGELEIGFGLAGCGYGVYTYCGRCSQVTSKTDEVGA